MSDAENAMNSVQADFKQAAETTYAKAGAAMSTGFSEAAAGLEKTQTQIKEQMEKAMKKAEEVASFGQGTVEAMVKSGQIWSTGMQDLGKQFAASAQSQFDETMSTFKVMTSLRSLKELMDVQSGFARATMEKAMSETGRMTDAGFRLAEEAAAPLTARVALAVETFSKPV